MADTFDLVPGHMYRHTDGTVVTMLVLARDTSDNSAVVVYKDNTTGIHWSRPFSEFTDGRYVRYV